MMVAIKRQPAFDSACPRVGSASIKTVSAAEEGASSWSQKLVSNDIVTAIHRRTAKPQELTGSPARRNANGVAAGSADVARTGNRIAVLSACWYSRRAMSRALLTLPPAYLERRGRCSPCYASHDLKQNFVLAMGRAHAGKGVVEHRQTAQELGSDRALGCAPVRCPAAFAAIHFVTRVLRELHANAIAAQPQHLDTRADECLGQLGPLFGRTAASYVA